MALLFTKSFRICFAKQTLSPCRSYSIQANADIRQRLMSEIKSALKNKDNVTSTTLRAVLSEVHAADKASSEPVGTSTIVSIIRKAALRRTEAAEQFAKASRNDLAEKEKKEISILSTFIPPLLPDAEIERILREILSEQLFATDAPGKAFGKLSKTFYSKVDKSTVDPTVVKKTAEALLSSIPKRS